MAEGLETTTTTLAGVEVRVVTYAVGSRFGAKVESLDVGNTLGRGGGATREEAATAAIEAASLVLELRSATNAFRAGAARLKR